MKQRVWSVEIAASRAKIWSTLWEDATYQQWTSAFSETTSYAVTDWQTGSKVLFVDGKGDGMVSRIAENRPNEFLSIEHLGMVKDGVEDMTSDEVKKWAGSHENYTLTGEDGAVTVTVTLELSPEYETAFDEMWPKALGTLKALAEG